MRQEEQSWINTPELVKQAHLLSNLWKKTGFAILFSIFALKYYLQQKQFRMKEFTAYIINLWKHLNVEVSFRHIKKTICSCGRKTLIHLYMSVLQSV